MFWITIFICYYLLVIWLFIGWRRTIQSEVADPKDASMILVSVIVPMRNERACIVNCIQCLSQQTYPAANWEVIFVDDHSDDGSFEAVEAYLKKYNFTNSSVIQSNGTGKKQALATGIKSAKGSIVITTDADCFFKQHWIQSMVNRFSDEKTKMVCGAVKIETTANFFSKLQAQEFSSLIGSGAATLAWGIPTMCNGANLAFRKDVFFEVGGYSDNLTSPSGDDEFLLRKIVTHYAHGVVFNTDQHSIVSTNAAVSVKDFVSQRIRWAGKWRLHKDGFSRFLPICLFIFYAVFLILPVAVSMGWLSWQAVVALLISKMAVEFIFLRSIGNWMKQVWHWPSFFLWQLLYPFYAILIGVLSIFTTYQWKGRVYRSS